jgi:anti-anti-sigma factor
LRTDATSDPCPHVTPISVIATTTESAVWIALVGELDLANADDLAGALAHVNLGGPGALPVHLDLSMLTFCDSRGIELLLDFQADLEAAGRSVGAHGARRPVRKLAGLLSGGHADFNEPLPLAEHP